jgi:hypothetical protein
VNKSKKFYLSCSFVVLMIFVTVMLSPRFLLYFSRYQKADAIILLLGPDFTARQKEAYRVIDEGLADYLIIPAQNKVYRVYNEGRSKYLSPNLSAKNGSKKDNTNSPGYYEDTHLELIEAKKAMDKYELHSAIFISSPYHMRRIKLISIKVFKNTPGEYYFLPTSYEKAPARFWELSLADWKKVGREYGKMLWFIIYAPLTD